MYSDINIQVVKSYLKLTYFLTFLNYEILTEKYKYVA